MPSKPAKPCRNPGCPRVAVRLGRCAEHAAEYEAQRKVQLAEVENRRGSSTERGYGLRWRRIRAAFLKAHPWCEVCGAVATDVHHKTPRRMGGTDAWSNLQALCHEHHSAVTLSSLGEGRQNR